MLAPDPAERQSHPKLNAGDPNAFARPEPEVQVDASRYAAKSPGKNDRKQKRQSSILRDATREFSLLRRPEAAEVERYKELFYQLVDRLEKNDRRLISAMLARSNFTPRPVALYFAQDALEVAAPFLLFSPVLNDLDLRAIAAKKGRLYADVIRKRKLPMEPFTASKLAQSESTDESVYASASSPVLSRSASENAPADKDALRDEILGLASKGGRTGRGKKTDAPVRQTIATPERIENELKASSATGKEGLRLPKSAVRELASLARQGKFDVMAQAIQTHCGLNANDTLKILRESKSDEPIYLIRALGIGSPHDIQLAMLIQPSIGRSIENYRRTKKTLSELDQGICQIIFNEIGARFELPREQKFAIPSATAAPVDTPASKMNNALHQRREAVTSRYHGNDRFAGGLADRWPGSQEEGQAAAISMAS